MNNYRNKLLSTVPIMTIILLILSIIFPTIVYTEETIQSNDSVFEMVGDIGVQKASKKGLTTSVNETIKVKNQTILLTESLYDGSSIHLAYVIKSYNNKDGTLADRFFDDIEFNRNGSSLFIDSMGAGGELLDNGDYAGTMTINFHENIPDSFILGIKSRHDDSVDAQIPIKLKGVAKSFPINETKKSDGKEITYDNITFYPTTTEIQIQNIINEDQKHFLMDIKLKVTDDKGYILQPLRAGGSGEPLGNGKIKVTSSYYFEPTNTIPKLLLIQPYLLDIQENYKPAIARKKWEGKAFTLTQGDAGSLSILDVKEDGDLLIVTYGISGEQDLQQVATIWVEDVEGKYYPGNYPPKQLSKNKFQLTFSSVDHLNKYYIATAKMHHLNYVKELETTVWFKD